MTGRKQNIQSQLDHIRAAQIAENRQKIKSIVETIIFCGRQNVPLRGHRDSALELEHDETANGGNFWALLQFRASAGDLVLRDHLAHAPRNAVYTSPDIQNQIINILGDYIRQKISLRFRGHNFSPSLRMR